MSHLGESKIAVKPRELAHSGIYGAIAGDAV